MHICQLLAYFTIVSRICIHNWWRSPKWSKRFTFQKLFLISVNTAISFLTIICGISASECVIEYIINISDLQWKNKQDGSITFLDTRDHNVTFKNSLIIHKHMSLSETSNWSCAWTFIPGKTWSFWVDYHDLYIKISINSIKNSCIMIITH